MPGPGPPPKQRPLGHRRHRTVEPLHHDGLLRGPALPETAPDGEQWHVMTREWWAAWRGSAQSQLFCELDWMQLLDTAAIHHLLWAHGRPELAHEVRLRAAKFGETPVDRLRLRISVDGEEHPS